MNRFMILYKYRPLQNFEFIADILVNEQLYCADYLSLNDPFEGQFLVAAFNLSKDPENPQYVFRRGDATSLQRDPESRIPRICSLSSDTCNMLLWGHYGGSHEGVAIGIEIDDDCPELFQVSYHNRLPAITNGERPTDAFPKFEPLTRKTTHWAHESEYRILSSSAIYPVPGRIRSVVLGCRFPSSKIQVIHRLNPDINIRHAVLDHDQASIAIE